MQNTRKQWNLIIKRFEPSLAPQVTSSDYLGMSTRFSKISSYLETMDYYLGFYLKQLNFSNPTCRY